MRPRSKHHRNLTSFLCVVVIGAAVFLAPAYVLGQGSGATLVGTATDAQGAAVPNVTVTATNIGTNDAVSVHSNGAGAYTIPNLNPGQYEVSAEAPGFSKLVSSVTLTVGAREEMNLSLKVGQIQQVINVTDAVPHVDLTSSSLSGVVDSSKVRELPLNGRDWASLAALQPGVSPVRTQLQQSHLGAGGRGLGAQLTIGGARPTQNSYRLDGILLNDYSNAGPGSVLGANLGVDAIQEFSVITTNYSADYGFTSGGVINAITRSGTNSFHGTAFEFLRNDVLDAAKYFENNGGIPKGHFEQNQFGVAAGWRILRDKLFVFGNYEGVRQTQAVPHSNDITISDAVKNGLVTNLSTGSTTQIPIDGNIQKFLVLFPSPTANAPCVQTSTGACNPNIGRFLFDGAQVAAENFYTVRGDYHVAASDTLSSTFMHDNSALTSPLTFNAILQGLNSYREAVVVQETHIFGNSMVNAARAGWNHTINLGGSATAAVNPAAKDPALGMAPGFFAPSIGLTGTQVPNSNNVVCGGYLNAGCGSPQNFYGAMMQFYDDLFVTKGNHGLKFGFNVIGYQLNAFLPFNSGNGSGTFSYQGTYPVVGGQNSVPTEQEAACLQPGATPGNGNNGYDQSCGSLVNFLTNQPRSAARYFDFSAITKHYLRSKIFAGYVQDDWRLRPTLTLNLGVRYEMSTNPTEINGKVASLPSIYTALPADPTTEADIEAVLLHKFFTRNPTLKNFEPRVGLAWDALGTGKLAVRAGFGLFDSLPLPYELAVNNSAAAPFRPTYAGLGPTPGVLASPAPGTWPFAVPSQSSQHIISARSRDWAFVQPDIKRNYVMQFNLNIQQELTPSLTMTIGYAGSRGFHSPFQDDSADTVLPVNLTHPIPGANNSSGKIPGVGYFWQKPWIGNLSSSAQQDKLLNPTCCPDQMFSTMWISQNWYDSMQIRVDKRLSHTFQAQGSFTWAKSLDNSSGSAAGDTFQLDPATEPWYDLSLDKGPSSFNIDKNLTVNLLWEPPGVTSHGMLPALATNGWEVGLIGSLTSGVPIPLLMDSTDILGEYIPTVDPPNLASGCTNQSMVNHNYRKTLQYINTNCITLVPQTAANATYCDTDHATQMGFPGTCPNIRGNIGRNALTGPGFFNTDLAIYKNNYFKKISETFNAQFRAEFFNVLNRTNFAPTANNVAFNNGQPQPGVFGTETDTQGTNREIQFAIKLIW